MWKSSLNHGSHLCWTFPWYFVSKGPKNSLKWCVGGKNTKNSAARIYTTQQKVFVRKMACQVSFVRTCPTKIVLKTSQFSRNSMKTLVDGAVDTLYGFVSLSFLLGLIRWKWPMCITADFFCKNAEFWLLIKSKYALITLLTVLDGLYVRHGKIQGQWALKKTKERPCISPCLT